MLDPFGHSSNRHSRVSARLNVSAKNDLPEDKQEFRSFIKSLAKLCYIDLYPTLLWEETYNECVRR